MNTKELQDIRQNIDNRKQIKDQPISTLVSLSLNETLLDEIDRMKLLFENIIDPPNVEYDSTFNFGAKTILELIDENTYIKEQAKMGLS